MLRGAHAALAHVAVLRVESTHGKLPATDKASFGLVHDVRAGRPGGQVAVCAPWALRQDAARPLYGSSLDCLVKTVRAEGAMALYKG